MKKLLIGTAAVAFGLTFAAPAMADGVTLDVGGHFKGYGVFIDQDEDDDEEVREFDFLRETEIHFSGETTLDNGLTVGGHIELDLERGTSSNLTSGDDTAYAGDADVETEEAYAYFSGAWGRINMGEEDGAAYLLQVASPSADSNVDGLRQYVQPINYGALVASADADLHDDRIDYDQDLSEKATKLTYLTPVFSGFQAGASYTPDVANSPNGTNGVNTDTNASADNGGQATDSDPLTAAGRGEAFDVALRWEGQFDEVGIAFGAGYSTVDRDGDSDAGAGVEERGSRDAWNIGLDLDWGPFGLGATYKEDDFGTKDGTAGVDDDEDIWTVGIDYTTGPFKLGASYLGSDNYQGFDDLDVERWTAGVVYTYGPGMTFRGSVQFVDFDNVEDAEGLSADITEAGKDSVDATSILIGTQINF